MLICRSQVDKTVGQNLLQVRTYDCIISYDKHYQTPRFWLFGYDEVSISLYFCRWPSSAPINTIQMSERAYRAWRMMATSSPNTITSSSRSTGELPKYPQPSLPTHYLRTDWQNKTPLSPTQVFQDVPSDHAFKTMTMEPFPHSGAQLASVHPCKHASVMKKFIDRMDEAGGSTAGSGAGSGSGSGSGGSGVGGGGSSGKGKGKWGIGGMVRRVTGSGKDVQQQQQQQHQQSLGEKDRERADTLDEEEGGGRVKGVQVDFYLVIVSSRTARLFFQEMAVWRYRNGDRLMSSF